MSNKVYNMNYLRPALKAHYENGNRGVITRTVCKNNGVSELYYEWYEADLRRLYDAVCEYVKVKNSHRASEEEKWERYNAIFPMWKKMLSAAEEDQFEKTFHVSECDVHDLIGFCQKFMGNKNDTSRGNDKTFVAQMVWSNDTFKGFQKKVEICLGIKIMEAAMLTNEERDFLLAEKRILSQWKKAEGLVKYGEDKKREKESLLKKAKSEELKKILKAEIAEINGHIELQNKKVEDAKKAWNALVNHEEDTKEERTVVTKPKRVRKAKKVEVVAEPKAEEKEVAVAAK